MWEERIRKWKLLELLIRAVNHCLSNDSLQRLREEGEREREREEERGREGKKKKVLEQLEELEMSRKLDPIQFVIAEVVER